MENIKTLGIKKIFAFTRYDAVNLIFSFLLGRVVLFGCVSPFALAYLAAYANNNPDNLIRSTLVAFAGLLGAFSAGMGVSLIKYILAFILFGLIFTAVTTLTEKRYSAATSGIAAASMAVSGIIFIGQYGTSFYYVAMLVTECIVCFAFAMCGARSLKIMQLPEADSTDDGALGLLALAAVSVLGFGSLSFGAVSLGKALAGLYIMILSACGGIGFGSAGGLGIGILYSFAMYPAIEAIGIFGICGMLCGYLSRYRRIGIICGYVLGNVLLFAYLGASQGSLMSAFDVAVSVILFCLVPKNVMLFVEGIVAAALPADRSAKKAINDVYKRLTCFAQSVTEIADMAGQLFNIKAPDNKNDIMTVFDKAADKVCKRCGLKFVCWDKEFNSTYDQLLHLSPFLKEKGMIEPQDISADFKARCIKYELYVSAVNKLYARYRLDNMWVKKVEAGKQLISQHLYGFAEIMNDFAEDTKNQLDFVPNPDNVLYLAIRNHGVKCYDCGVIKTQASQYEVWIKAALQDNIENIVADITSQTFGRKFYIKDVKRQEKRVTVTLLEREKYSVRTGGAARTKDGSKSCGDSYCQKKLEHNRHLAILSDGMGSGENARAQSLYAVNVMLRLLNSGFNKECAIKIMNLSLFLRQNEESFATVDAAVIDLFEGNAEFIKIGASSSFVKRGESIKKISSDSLPAGMLTDITPCSKKVSIKSGDIIVLASDGVTGSDDSWLEGYLAEACEPDPQTLAENIVKEAIIKNDHTVSDDMTVVTLLIDEEVA